MFMLIHNIIKNIQQNNTDIRVNKLKRQNLEEEDDNLH